MEVYFDDIDSFILANRLSPAELRREVQLAQKRATERDMFLSIPYECLEVGYQKYYKEYCQDFEFPFEDYIEICRQAIACQKAKPKQKPAPGRGRIDPEAIKSRNDIVAVVEQYTILRKSGHNRFLGSCPLHEDKHPSMTVYADNQSWHCFQCNRGGDIIAFIQAVENTDFRGAAAILERA